MILNKWLLTIANAYKPDSLIGSTLYMLGDNTYGQLGDNSTLSTSAYNPNVSTARSWAQISIGANHTLAIRSDGYLFTWGRNDLGQLGTSVLTNSSVPVQVGIYQWTSITTKENTSYGIRNDGKLFAWGYSFDGELGNDSIISDSLKKNWFSLGPGDSHTVGILSDGTLWSWGLNTSGELGLGNVISRSSPVQIGTSLWTTVRSGNIFSLAVRQNGSLFVWGSNASGQLGLGNTVNRSSPTQVGTSSWALVSGGDLFSLGTSIDGTLWSWGNNAVGQLGQGLVNVHRSSPVLITTLNNETSIEYYANYKNINPYPISWNKVAANSSTTAAITSEGELYTWGVNTAGMLGLNDIIDKSYPTKVGTSSWLQVSVGDNYMMGILADNTVFAWGTNTNGRLGLNDSVHRSSPVQIGTLTAEQIVVGAGHTIARNSLGQLYMWGVNTGGQILTVTSNTSSPTLVNTENSWTFVTAGASHSMGISTDGTLWAWGTATVGQLGDGGTTNRSSPVIITSIAFEEEQEDYLSSLTSPPALLSWININAGALHGLGIQSDGTLWAWGTNTQGQLGTNNIVTYSYPVKIGTDTWNDISAGTSHSLAIRSDNAVLVWGGNGSGQLGLNDLVHRSSPVQLGSGGLGYYSVKFNGSSDYLLTTSPTLTGQTFTIECWIYLTNYPLSSSGSYRAQILGNKGNTQGFEWTVGGTATSYTNAAFYTATGGVGSNRIVVSYAFQLNTWYHFAIVKNGNDYEMFVDGTSIGTATSSTTWTENTALYIGKNITNNFPYFFPGYISNLRVVVGTAVYTSNFTPPTSPLTAITGTELLTCNNSTYSDSSVNNYTVTNFSTTAITITVPFAPPSGLVTASAIRAGSIHSMMLNTSNILYLWGDNASGQLGTNNITSTSSPVTTALATRSWSTITAGTNFSAAIDTTGTLYTWGINTNGNLGIGDILPRSNPMQITTIQNVDMENSYAAAIGVTVTPMSYTQVSFGQNHAVALTSDGAMWTWGINTNGQLGDNTNLDNFTPIKIGNSSWTQVHAGGTHTVAIRSDNAVFTWGANTGGILGLGDAVHRSSPTQLGTLSSGYYSAYFAGSSTNYLSIANNSAFALETSTTWTLELWVYFIPASMGVRSGIIANRPFGATTTTGWILNKSVTDSLRFAYVNNATELVSADNTIAVNTWYHVAITRSGTSHVMYINGVQAVTATISGGTTSSAALIIGQEGASGNIGLRGYISNLRICNGTVVYNSNFTPSTSPLTTTSQSASNCVLLTLQDNPIIDNSSNVFTITEVSPTTTITVSPAITSPFNATLTATNAIQIRGANWNTYYLGTDYSLYAMGQNLYGNIGDNSVTAEYLPTKIGNSSWTLIGVESTGQAAAAIRTDGALFVWGLNSYGLLGFNDLINRSSPTQIGTSSWTLVSMDGVSLAIRSDGTLWSWGQGINGELGYGIAGYRSAPVQVGVSSWSYVKAGGAGVAAGFINNTLYIWGRGGAGAIGNSSTVSRSSPVQIGTSSWTYVASGTPSTDTNASVAAIRSDGRLFTWGSGHSGFYGNSSTSPARSSPVQITTIRDSFTSVGAGDFHLGLIRNDGLLFTSGLNSGGQLGNGNQVSKSRPVQVGALNTSGYYSVAFDGTGDALTVSSNAAFALGTGNFTIEFWVYPVLSSGVTFGRLVQFGPNTTAGGLWITRSSLTNPMGILVQGYSGGAYFNIAGTPTDPGTTIPTDSWSHVALVRDTSLFKLYLNGTLFGSSVSAAYNIVQNAIYVGANSAIGETIQAYISNLRIRTVAVYSGSTFTPPTSPLTVIDSSTVLLTCQDNTYIDNSDTAATITTSGNIATESVIIPFDISGNYTSWTQVKAGASHTIAINADGSLFTFGLGTSGQLGVNDVVSRSSPTKIGSYSWTTISGGTNTTMAIRLDQTLFVWGLNSSAQLGNYRLMNASSPSIIKSINDSWTLVNAGAAQTAAIRTDKLLFTFGSNTVGQLGQDTTISRSAPVQVGAGRPSGYFSNTFNGVNQYIQWATATQFQLGTGNFTIEAWIYVNNFNQFYPILTKGGSTTDWFFGLQQTSGVLYFQVGTNPDITATSTVALNTWQHVAVVRISNVIYFYIDGVLDGSGAMASNLAPSGAVRVGRGRDSSTNYLDGKISNVRLVKGVAVYTGNFTVPTTPLMVTQSAGTNISAITGTQTSLLTARSSMIRDSSSFNAATTNYGSVTSTYENPFGEPPLSAQSTWADIVTTQSTTVALKEDYSLYAWGFGTSGQVGNNNIISVSSPVLLGTKSWLAIGTGLIHSTAIDSSGKLYTWGLGTGGSLGTVSLASTSSPVIVKSINDSFVRISAGGSHSIVIRDDYSPFVWGLNTSGQLGLNDLTNRSLPTLIGSSINYPNGYYSVTFDGNGDYLSVPASSNYSYGTGDFTIECWIRITGVGTRIATNRLNAGSSAGTWSWIVLNNSTTFTEVVTGEPGVSVNFTTPLVNNTWYHVAAVRISGNITFYLNGTSVGSGSLTTNFNNSSNSLDFGWDKDNVNPDYLQGNLSNMRIVKGLGVYTGNFTVPTSPLSTTQSSSTNISAITAGQTVFLGMQSSTFVDVANNATITVVGNTSISVIIPFNVASVAEEVKYTSASAGALHTAAINTSNILYTWGTGVTSGALGDGLAVIRSSPVQISSIFNDDADYLTYAISGGVDPYNPPLNSWAQIGNGASYAIGLRTDGRLFSWGGSTNGELGQNSRITYSIPQSLGTSSWTYVSSGLSHVLAVRSDGALFGWGSNTNGQLGQIDLVHRSSPTQIGTSSFTSVGTNANNSAAIASDGALFAWGLNDAGQVGDFTIIHRSSPVQVQSGLSWISVTGKGGTPLAAGTYDYSTVVALRSDGTIWGWGGPNSNNVFMDPDNVVYRSSPIQIGTSSWTQISYGDGELLALKSDGSLWSSGTSSLYSGGRSNPVQIGTSSWTSIHAGRVGTNFAIRSDGRLFVWGNDIDGSTGLPGQGGLTVTSPTQVGTSSWVTVSSGIWYALAIKVDGSLWSWGRNTAGQLGTNNIISRSSPINIGTSSWSAVSAGSSFSGAIRSDGSLFMWGWNLSGMLGNNATTANRSSPVQIGTSSWTYIGAGLSSTAAIRFGGGLFTWGQSANGILGNNSITPSRSSPVQLGTSSWTILANVGAQAAISVTGALFMWGLNTNGNLGIGNVIHRSSPVQVGIALTANSFSQISVGLKHMLGIDNSGKLYAWGLNTWGQAQSINSSLATVINTSSWSMVSAGNSHSTGISNQSLFAWGNNGFGQLGFNDTVHRSIPTQVGTSSWVSVSAGTSYTAGLEADNSLYIWGGANNGVLGISNSTVHRSSPVQVGTSSWSQVYSGDGLVFATKVTGSLFAWGTNTTYSFGKASFSPGTSSPVFAATPVASWNMVGVGRSTTYAARSDDALFAWGLNTSGQIGDNTVISKSAPVQLRPGNNTDGYFSVKFD